MSCPALQVAEPEALLWGFYRSSCIGLLGLSFLPNGRSGWSRLRWCHSGARWQQPGLVTVDFFRALDWPVALCPDWAADDASIAR
jgi:hypothetical protein